MIFILGRARLLCNFVGFARPMGSLARRTKKPIFVDCQRILNFNGFRMRTVALSAEKREEDRLFNDKFEREIYQLNLDVNRQWVFKEDFQKLFENLKQYGEMSHFQMMLLMKCCTDISFLCSEKERIKIAEDIWETAVKFGVKIDTKHYNELLNVFLINNHHFSHKNYLKNMEEAGVTPDLMTYRYLLRASCKQGDILGAKDLLDKMKNLNFSLDIQDFNSLIQGHSKIGDFEKAHEIFKIIKSKGMKPTSTSYVYLLCGYIEHGNLDKFKEIFNELHERNHINFSDSDLLEIIYTLAIKKEESHIDMVLERLTKKPNYDRLVTKYMQRLFHMKLDSVAWKILETVDVTGRSFNYALSISRYVLHHFIYYRNPNEILNTCEELEKRGYARVAVGYCLKKIFSTRNENFALSFILHMKAREIPIREHYYWPIIIQGSKKGNEQFLSILNKVPMWVRNKPDSAYSIILPNYRLSGKWDSDLEQLSKLGVPRYYSARYFLVKFLKENQIDVVEQLVSTYPVHPFKLKHIFNILFGFLEKNPEKVKQVVNILYNLYHDAHLFEDIFDKKKTSEPLLYFDQVLTSFLQMSKDEKIILPLLEAMLEKKMGISSEIASMVIQSFPSHNVNELVSKLSDPNLKIELNETLLTLKRKLAQTRHSSDKEDQSSEFTSLKECIKYMVTLAENFKFTKAIKIGENFVQQNKEVTEEDTEYLIKLYRNFFNKTFRKKDESLLTKSFDLGNRLGIFNHNRNLNDLFVLGLLNCGNTSRALEIFKEISLNTGKPVACVELLMKCISEEKTKEVQQITDLITEIRTRNLALSFLTFALAALGEVEKAKKLLDNEGFVFQGKLLLKDLSRIKNPEVLENLKQVLKNVYNFDSTEFYKILAKNYAKRHEVDKIQQLWLEIQEKNISDKNFLKQLSDFQEDLNVTRLFESIIVNFPKIHKRTSAEENFSRPLFETINLEKKYLSAMENRVSTKEALSLAIQLAHQGNVDHACSLVESYSIENNIHKIASAFLASNKINEYLKFLEFFATKGDFSALNECFRVPRLIPALEKDDELFKKYKSLLLQCADETHFSKPVISCFVTCAKLPGKLADAEEILDKYSSYFKDISFSQIKEVVEMTEFASNFYENILSSKKLKGHFFDYLHVFYNKVIALKVEENNLNTALNYLDQAISDKVEDLLDKNLIEMLKRNQKMEITVPGMDSER